MSTTRGTARVIDNINYEDSLYVRTTEGGPRQSIGIDSARACTVENNANRPLMFGRNMPINIPTK